MFGRRKNDELLENEKFGRRKIDELLENEKFVENDIIFSSSNIYRARSNLKKAISIEDADWPDCKDPCELNAASFYECDEDICCQDNTCFNRQFTDIWKKGKLSVLLKVELENFEMGLGVRVLQDIPRQGTLVGEYVGRVISEKEYSSLDKTNKKRRSYVLKLGSVKRGKKKKENVYIDAFEVGESSMMRYVNHQCSGGSLEIQKWYVRKVPHIGYFSTRPIKDGEYLSVSYEIDEEPNLFKCVCKICANKLR